MSAHHPRAQWLASEINFPFHQLGFGAARSWTPQTPPVTPPRTEEPSKSEKSNEMGFWAFAKDRKALTIEKQSGGHLSFSCLEKPPCPPLRVTWWHLPAPPPRSCEGGWDLSQNFISSTVFGPGMDCAGKKKQQKFFCPIRHTDASSEKGPADDQHARPM